MQRAGLRSTQIFDGGWRGCQAPLIIVQGSTVHTMEYCLALKRNEILTHGTTWKSLEDVKLSEISRLEKDSAIEFYLN